MSRKKQNNEATNVEVQNTEMQLTEATQLKENNAIEEAEANIAKLKEAMAEAKKKLAEAKKATTKSRPVRMSRFVVRVSETRDEVGEKMTQSDVHYCAEKAAIDVLSEDIKNNIENKYFYTIWKELKADENSSIVVARLWIDENTKQIVIE